MSGKTHPTELKKFMDIDIMSGKTHTLELKKFMDKRVHLKIK